MMKSELNGARLGRGRTAFQDAPFYMSASFSAFCRLACSPIVLLSAAMRNRFSFWLGSQEIFR